MQADNHLFDRRSAGVLDKTAGFLIASAAHRGVVVHLLRCLLLLVAGVWACLAGPLAAAQHPSVLVSNLAQTRDQPQGVGDRLTARQDYVLGIVFRTGQSEKGWLPTAVTLDVNRWPGRTTPIVSLYRAGFPGDQLLPVPTTRITTLENPWPGMGWRRFTVPARVRLEPDAFYAVVVKSTATTADGAFELRGTKSNDEDARSLSGWDIDSITYVTANDTDWGEQSGGASTLKVRFAAYGYDAAEAYREGAKLESLSVTPVSGSLASFTPSFKPVRRGPYTVWVTHDTTQVTLAAVAESSSAEVDMPDDVNPHVEGTQINLPAGTTTSREVRVFDGPNDIFRTHYRLDFKRPGSALNVTLEPLEPVSNGGSLRYRFAVRLSAPVDLPLAEWKNDVFTVTNGSIVGAKRIGGAAAGPGGDPISRTWRIAVSPTDAAVDTTVAYQFKNDCDEIGALCTVGGLMPDIWPQLTFGPSVLRSVSVSDSSANEGDGQIEFTISLSRPSPHFVHVDFETIDSGPGMGTATPSGDYWPQFTRLIIPPGSTSIVAGVGLIADSINDDGETVRVRLGNARTVGDGGVVLKPLKIAAAEATGTIDNAGAMPQAWLARFGRTVADQVLGAVEGRMSAPRTPGTELSVAGQRIGGGPAAASGEALSDWLRSSVDEEGSSGFATRAVTRHDLLTGSSFAFTGGTPESGAGTLWGRGAVSRFHGHEGSVALDGDVVSALAGLDWTRGSTTAGLVVSHSRGDGSYRSPSDGGTVESSLTGLYPWSRYALSDRLSVWGVAGYGAGELVLTPKEQLPMETDTELRMAAAGLRGVLMEAPADDGFELAVTSDGMLVRTSSDEVRGNAGSLAASEADVTRFRVGFEGAWRGLDAGGGSFVPSFEIGLRHDGGDAETGLGVEAGAGLAWADPASGIKAEVRARGLLTHEAAGFRERGFAGTLAWDPNPASDRGPALSLSQTMGVQAAGGANALFERPTIAGLGVDGSGRQQRRFEARFGYGIAAFDGRVTVTPEAGFGFSDAGRDFSLGWRLSPEGAGAGSLELAVEATRRENDNADPEHAFGVELSARY